MDDEDGSRNRIVALLDFPKGGMLGLDGQNIVLKTSDFLGVKDVPSNSLHLVTCKNGNAPRNDGSSESNAINTAVTVGFLIFEDGTDTNDLDRHFIRRYDPRTEEVACRESSPVDHLTRKNLIEEIQTINHQNPSRVLSYNQIVQGGHGTISDGNNPLLTQQSVWGEQTRFIHESRQLLLRTLHGLSSGDKIVPGCYDPDADGQPTAKKDISQMDGRSLVYPPIPVVDPKLSLSTHKHMGTKRFLSKISPSDRSRLFLSVHNDGCSYLWLETVLRDYYQNSWQALLGDLQLSYLLFLNLGCYSSLEHWKDLLAMLSLAVDGNDERNRKYQSLFRGLLRLLPFQLSSMTDPEFLEDVEEGGGNFLIPSLQRLFRYFDRTGRQKQGACVENNVDHDENELFTKFKHVLASKFAKTFTAESLFVPTVTTMEDSAMVIDDDDEDGPIIVAAEEIEASMARIDARPGRPSRDVWELRKDYPLLAAAVMPQEDVLMTCARALDEQNDVSLVREAAAYLEEVEQKRNYF